MVGKDIDELIVMFESVVVLVILREPVFVVMLDSARILVPGVAYPAGIEKERVVEVAVVLVEFEV